MNGNDVLITGIGLLSTLGEGTDANWDALNANRAPRLNTESFAPYVVHPLPEVDWALQIPRKEQRQMEQWQRLGTYTAGLALADAGMKENEALTTSMDLIVAAGGGERDVSVDTQILDASRTRNDRDVMLNEKLTTELRPTLFLAQLSNLLAGNISIVHQVTGSSRTFMGEEGAGMSALQTAVARIKSGQSTHILVGGALNAEHLDICLSYELNGFLKRDGWSPLWARQGSEGGGVITGSGSAFLVLESRAHAEGRGARAYAKLASVSGNQATRNGDLEQSISSVLENVSPSGADIIYTGASGAHDAISAEIAVAPYGTAVRGFAGVTGHLKEAQFPFAVALAALSVSKGASLPSIDASHEKAAPKSIDSALALTVGYHRGEGAALVTKA